MCFCLRCGVVHTCIGQTFEKYLKLWLCHKKLKNIHIKSLQTSTKFVLQTAKHFVLCERKVETLVYWSEVWHGRSHVLVRFEKSNELLLIIGYDMSRSVTSCSTCYFGHQTI